MIYCLWYGFECTFPGKAIRTISEPLLVTWLFRVTIKLTRVWDSNIRKLLDILDIYDTEMLTALFLLSENLNYGHMQHYVNLQASKFIIRIID